MTSFSLGSQDFLIEIFLICSAQLGVGLSLSFLCQICFNVMDDAVSARSLSEICEFHIHTEAAR